MAPALVGAAIGSAAGLLLARRLDAIPPWDFVAGTATLALLAAVTAAILPAVFAATRDPVRARKRAADLGVPGQQP